jgi:hypothetical protein
MKVLLLAAATLLLCACSGKNDLTPPEAEKQAYEDLKAAIQMSFDDEQRRADVLASFDQMTVHLNELKKNSHDRLVRFRALNANYDTTPEEMRAFTQEMIAEFRENRNKVNHMYKEIAELTSPEEREKLEKVRTAAIKATIASMQAMDPGSS